MVAFTDVIEYGDFKTDIIMVGDLYRVMRSRGYQEHRTAASLFRYLREQTSADRRIKVVRANNHMKVRGVCFKNGITCPPKRFLALARTKAPEQDDAGTPFLCTEA
jgi:predicted transcriptional regulator